MIVVSCTEIIKCDPAVIINGDLVNPDGTTHINSTNLLSGMTCIF